MKTSEQINELAAALAIVQGKLKPAKMDAVNPFLKNRYADLPSIISACQPLISENGLAYTQMPTTSGGEGFGISITTRLMHKSGQWIEDTFFMPMPPGEKGIIIMQLAGSAITYARRYALASMLGIVADEDTDGNQPPSKKPKAPADNLPAPRTYTDGSVLTNSSNFSVFDAFLAENGRAPGGYDELKQWAASKKS